MKHIKASSKNNNIRGKGSILLPSSLILAGAALMTAGIYRGEVTVVVIKAINLCLECIGIG